MVTRKNAVFAREDWSKFEAPDSLLRLIRRLQHKQESPNCPICKQVESTVQQIFGDKNHAIY